jgi:branched-chain amino acid transport system substrate-binding protein
MQRRLIAVLLMTACSCVNSGSDGTDPGSMGFAELESGRFEEAAAHFREAISQAPDDPSVPEWRLGIAEASLGLGDLETAVTEAQEAWTTARSDRVRGGAMLLKARVEAARGNQSRCAAALVALDTGWLSSEDAGAAETLARECLSSIGSSELLRLRGDDWLEPYVLFETWSRYVAQGDTERAALTAGELDRLYPGFREAPQDTASAPESPYIALLLPLTGEGSVYAGQIENGVELAFQRSSDLLSRMPELVELDFRGDPDDLDRLAEQLGRDDRCIAVIGPMTSRETSGISDEAGEYGLAFLSPSATSSEIDRMGSYVHRLVPASADEAAAMAEYAVNSAGCSDIAILHSYTQASVAQAEQFAATVRSLGAEIALTRAFDTEDTDFRAQILAIRATRPDGIFLPVTAYEAIQIAPQLRFYSLEVPIFGTSGWDSDMVTRLGGEYVEGAVFPTTFGSGSLNPETARFVFHYNRSEGEDPSILAAQGYDAAGVILQAWAGGRHTREAVERWLNDLTVYEGASGMSTIGARTDMRIALPLVTILDGEVVGVE